MHNLHALRLPLACLFLCGALHPLSMHAAMSETLAHDVGRSDDFLLQEQTAGLCNCHSRKGENKRAAPSSVARSKEIKCGSFCCRARFSRTIAIAVHYHQSAAREDAQYAAVRQSFCRQ